MHIAEVVTIAKSLPLLRLNTYKSLILSYSADYRRIFRKNNSRNYCKYSYGYYYNMVGEKPLFPLHQIMNQFDFVIINTSSQSFLYFAKMLQFRMSLHEITDFLFMGT